MKNKAFTLIELLAVIIILGILMLIAIPSVTNYINNSRKSTYVTTVNELVKATIAKVNSGDLNMFDTDTTYYVPCTCIKLENGEAKSPYGKFDPAYVVVTFDGTNYNYYFTGKDVQNMGVPVLTSSDVLSKESIVANVEAIDTSVGIEGTSNVYVFSDECNGEGETNAVGTTVPGGSSGSGGSGTTPTPGVSQLQADGTCPLTGKICKRANVSTLHTEECNSNASCYGAGYYVGGSKGTSTITYGNTTTTSGTLTTGDAFDCDVNCDGVYDPEEERFYYVSDYWDTGTQSIDNTYAVLMHSTNFTGGERVVGGKGQYFTYEDAVEAVPSVASGNTTYPNYVGPVTGVKNLPKTTKWRKDLLKTRTRRIYSSPYTGYAKYTETDTTACYGKELPSAFSYGNCAARLITVFEVSEGCIVDKYSNNTINKCMFMFEGTYYVNNSYGTVVWYENPTVHGSGNIYYAYVFSSVGGIGYTDGNNLGSIKPTIDVLKTKIEY